MVGITVLYIQEGSRTGEPVHPKRSVNERKTNKKQQDRKRAEL